MTRSDTRNFAGDFRARFSDFRMHSVLGIFFVLSTAASAAVSTAGAPDATGAPPGEPATEAAPEPIAGAAPSPQVAPPRPRRYGDRGTPEIAIGLGYSSVTGFLGAGGFRYFVLDGVAPGVEGTYVSGGDRQSAY